MNGEINYIQFEKLEDIIRMMSASMRSPPLHHKVVKDGHIYFLPASLALGKAVIYFVKVKEKVEKKYIVLDTVHDKISFSDEHSTKPKILLYRGSQGAEHLAYGHTLAPMLDNLLH